MSDGYDYYFNYSYNGGVDGAVYDTYYAPYYDEYYDLFVYKSFQFERSVYLYVWEALVILTTLANILVIAVFIRKRMRNSTNVILMSIAVTDSLTGVVTLPVYIYVYGKEDQGGPKLTEEWCEAFMYMKFLVSKAFHTMSIWLTVCLAFQRLVAVRFPFRAQTLFTTPKTIVMVVVIAILSPLLHMYHLFHSKAVDGGLDSESETGKECVWKLEEPCEEGCIYLWLTFYLAHFIPCLLLVVFTAVMLIVLCKTVRKLQTTHSIASKDTILRRNADSRRISLIVVVVVVIFLIPEVPYGLYVLINVTLHLSPVGIMDLKTNRLFHCVYEISLVASFHANFWIYFILNKRFRKSLKRLFLPVCVLCFGIVGTIRRRGSSFRRRSGSSSFGTQRHTHPTSGLEMNTNPDREVPA